MRRSVTVSKQFVFVGAAIVSLALALVSALRFPNIAVRATTHGPQIKGHALKIHLQDTNGEWHDLSSLHGRYVLIVFFCGCIPCQQINHRFVLIKQRRPEISVLGITAMSSADVKSYEAYHHINFPILTDPYFRTSRQWNSTECPKCWIIDPGETIAYGSSHGDSASSILAVVNEYFPS